MSTRVVFWDVQHGSATYLKSPNERHIIIDLGTGSYGDKSTVFSPLRHLKFNYGINKIDYAVVTHPHKDHIDDILNFNLLDSKVFCRPNHIPHNEILEGVSQNDLPKFNKYIEIDNRFTRSLTYEDIDNPSNPNNFGGLEISSFGAKSCPTSNLNNQSIIHVFKYANSKVIITGDNESCSFDELLKDKNFCSAIEGADILLAPHHGRESGYHNDFVTKVNPKIVIISDGRFCDNSATSRYSDKCSGWKVHKRSGGTEIRKCLTTRSDGVIVVDFGLTSENRPFLSVTIN